MGYKEKTREFIKDSNISIVAAEILIPYLLLLGYKSINGVDMITPIYGKSTKKTIKYIRWYSSVNMPNVDYSISFLKTENKAKEKIISAKSNKSNKSTIISSLRNYVDCDKLYFDNKTLIGKILTSLKLIKKDPIYNNAFACWIIGYVCQTRKILTKSKMLEMHKIFMNLKDVNFKLSKSYKSYINKFFGFDTKTIKTPLYPYSLTDIFEKSATMTLNNEKNIEALETIYDIKMKECIYTQIEMNNDKDKVFTISVKKPFDKEKKQHIKLVPLCGCGKMKNLNGIKDKISLMIRGGGKGQFIGFTLL